MPIEQEGYSISETSFPFPTEPGVLYVAGGTATYVDIGDGMFDRTGSALASLSGGSGTLAFGFQIENAAQTGGTFRTNMYASMLLSSFTVPETTALEYHVQIAADYSLLSGRPGLLDGLTVEIMDGQSTLFSKSDFSVSDFASGAYVLDAPFLYNPGLGSLTIKLGVGFEADAALLHLLGNGEQSIFTFSDGSMTYAAVPEPSSMILLGVAGAGLLWQGSRRRKSLSAR